MRSQWFRQRGNAVGPNTVGSGHKYHRLLEETEEKVPGTCSYCAKAYGVKDPIERTDVELLDEFDGHPSIRKLFSNGYQVLTF
jgi:hypothetical protein